MPFTRALSLDPAPNLDMCFPPTPPTDNPFEGYYASLLYFGLPLDTVFQSVLESPFSPSDIMRFDWRDDAGVHLYIQFLTSELTEHLERDPTAAFDDPLILRICASASHIASVLKVDPSFTLPPSSIHWWMNIGSRTVNPDYLFIPNKPGDNYPRTRSYPVTFEYTWSHRILPISFSNTSCPLPIKQMITKARLAAETAASKPDISTLLVPETPNEQNQGLLTLPEPLVLSRSLSLIPEITVLADTPAQLITQDPRASFIKINATPPRRIPSSSVINSSTSFFVAESPSASATEPLTVIPTIDKPLSTAHDNDHQLIASTAPDDSIEHATALKSDDDDYPESSTNLVFPIDAPSGAANPYRGHYASLLYFTLPLFQVFHDINALPYIPKEFSWLHNTFVHSYIESFYLQLIRHIMADPRSVLDDSLVIRFAVTASRIAETLKAHTEFILPPQSELWCVELDDPEDDIHSYYIPILPIEQYPLKRAPINEDYHWDRRATVVATIPGVKIPPSLIKLLNEDVQRQIVENWKKMEPILESTGVIYSKDNFFPSPCLNTSPAPTNIDGAPSMPSTPPPPPTFLTNSGDRRQSAPHMDDSIPERMKNAGTPHFLPKTPSPEPAPEPLAADSPQNSSAPSASPPPRRVRGRTSGRPLIPSPVSATEPANSQPSLKKRAASSSHERSNKRLRRHPTPVSEPSQDEESEPAPKAPASVRINKAVMLITRSKAKASPKTIAPTPDTGESKSGPVASSSRSMRSTTRVIKNSSSHALAPLPSHYQDPSPSRPSHASASHSCATPNDIDNDPSTRSAKAPVFQVQDESDDDHVEFVPQVKKEPSRKTEKKKPATAKNQVTTVKKGTKGGPKRQVPSGGGGHHRGDPDVQFALPSREQSPVSRYSWNRDLYTVRFGSHSQTITDGMVPLSITAFEALACHSCATHNNPEIFETCGGPVRLNGKCANCIKRSLPCSLQLSHDIGRHMTSHGLMPIVAADPSNIYNAGMRVVENAAAANAAVETARLTSLAYYEALYTYQQLVGHQLNTTLPTLWSQTFSSSTPINDILSLDTASIQANIERLCGEAPSTSPSGDVVASTSSAAGPSHLRQYIDIRRGN